MRAPQTVRVTGGAHLTVAFALGSALPATLVGNVTAEGTDDSVWQTGTVSAPPSAVALTRIEGHGARPVTATGTAKNVLAYVDHIRGRLGGAGRHDLPERPHRDGFGGDVVDGVVEAQPEVSTSNCQFLWIGRFMQRRRLMSRPLADLLVVRRVALPRRSWSLI